jgi:hypothetical protein
MDDEEMAEEYIKVNNLEWELECNRTSPIGEVKQAYLAGLKAGRPEWHKVADGDLPKHEVNVLVLFNKQCIDIAHYNYDYKEWHFADSIVRDIIAWCEISTFTDKELDK